MPQPVDTETVTHMQILDIVTALWERDGQLKQVPNTIILRQGHNQ